MKSEINKNFGFGRVFVNNLPELLTADALLDMCQEWTSH